VSPPRKERKAKKASLLIDHVRSPAVVGNVHVGGHDTVTIYTYCLRRGQGRRGSPNKGTAHTHTRIANSGSDKRFTVEENQYMSIHIKQENEIWSKLITLTAF
jgi:hypothetical protein